MSALHDAVEEYLTIRRALGSPVSRAAAQLRRFADFVTTQCALRWAQQSTHAQPATWAERLGVVRRFAAWRSITDWRTRIPPRGLLPHRRSRKPPYVYSDKEIERVVAQAARLSSAYGLRGPTFATLFGLLAASGLRLGEALGLD
jgi:integrase/recombinase XerD